MSPNDDKSLEVPPIISDYWGLLRSTRDPAVRLRAIRGIGQWLRAVEEAEIERAREAGMTWEEIGAAQDRPRQVVHRQASGTPYRPNVRGLTSPLFDNVGTPDLRVWEMWWLSSDRSPDGFEEKGRDPLIEARRIRAEIDARERMGVAGPNRDRTW